MGIRFKRLIPGGLPLWFAGMSQDGVIVWVDDRRLAFCCNEPKREDLERLISALTAASEGSVIQIVPDQLSVH